MHRLLVAPALAACVAAAATACTIGAPPGFSDGDSWTIPLVGPMENGVLVAPVFVNDHGPYLMVLDPDAPQSAVDEAIVSELKLHSGSGPRAVDESDTTRPTHLAEVKALRLGGLTVRSIVARVTPLGAHAVAGRQIRGIVGRDVLADSLVYGFDRDRGTATIATRQGFTAPAGAEKFGFSLLFNDLPVGQRPADRRLVEATIGAGKFTVHLDLGDTRSQLRQSLWAKGGLAAVPSNVTFVDDVGSRRKTTTAGLASAVALGGVSTGQMLFSPYDDKRWNETNIDGSLGLAFFRDYTVWADFDKKDLYVVPRSAAAVDVKDRLARWNSTVLDTCEHTGCVDAVLEIPVPPAVDPPPPPPERSPLTVRRDASAMKLNLEVLIEAVATGPQQPIAGGRFVVNLPAGTPVAQVLVPTEAFANATWVVRDVSPYPRDCPDGGACIMALAE